MTPTFLLGLGIGALVGWICTEMWRELRADVEASFVAMDATLPPLAVRRARSTVRPITNLDVQRILSSDCYDES